MSTNSKSHGATPSLRGIWRFTLGCLAVAIAIAPSVAFAIVPINATVPVGTFDAAVRITNSQGARGTGTLFFKSIDPDPADPIANPARYMNLSFLTADHVLRPLGPGGVVNSPDNDIYPYPEEDAPNYGGEYDPNPAPVPGKPGYSGFLQSIGFRGVDEPTAFTLSSANGMVRRKVVLGDGLSLIGNKRADIAMTSIVVDLKNPNLTAAQKALLNNLIPNNLVAPVIPPAVGPFPVNLPLADQVNFNIGGGYGLSGRPDLAEPLYDYVYHPPAPGTMDEQYGRERFLNNKWVRFVATPGFYNYIAMQWHLTNLMGVGMSGDSGAGLLVGGNLNGVLTAGAQDKLLGGKYGLKIGYSEIGAPITLQALAKFMATAQGFKIPEPSTYGLLLFAIASLGFRRSERLGQ